MYKIFSICIFFICANWLPAADLTTETGRTYLNVEVLRCVAGCVQIRHDNGMANLDWNDLPDIFIAALSNKQRENLQEFADLTLANGRVLQKACVVSLSYGHAIFLHTGGRTRVPVKALPRKFIVSLTRKQYDLLHKKKVDKQPAVVEVTADGRTVYRGSRGGRYYLDNGRKVYLPQYRERPTPKK